MPSPDWTPGEGELVGMGGTEPRVSGLPCLIRWDTNGKSFILRAPVPVASYFSRIRL